MDKKEQKKTMIKAVKESVWKFSIRENRKINSKIQAKQKIYVMGFLMSFISI